MAESCRRLLWVSGRPGTALWKSWMARSAVVGSKIVTGFWFAASGRANGTAGRASPEPRGAG
eukprot:3915194-Lingulodinium_polyedra.AAC.1